VTNLHHPSPPPDPAKTLALAREVLEIEAEAVLKLTGRLGDAFLAAVAMILASTGRVVVTGMGKSGHVGSKIASTLASTGTPAYFMHPGEASHGDLGMIVAEDVVIAISNSGESDELLRILPLIKRRGAKVIATTGRPHSTLAKEADAHLDAGVAREACPMNLAPTASTTATLALGDALAVALLDARGFGREAYGMHHPGRQGQSQTLGSPEAEAKRMATQRAADDARGSLPTDPNSGAPKAGQDVGGYNSFYVDAGTHYARINGEVRSSWIVDPPNGKIPYTPTGKKKFDDGPYFVRNPFDGPGTPPMA